MTKEDTSILSTGVNFILAGLKLTIGLMVKSTALVADGIHSSLDIFASFITFLGIKIAKKPVDTKHPYGLFRAETIAGFIVVFILLFTSLSIIYEGVQSIIKSEHHIFGIWALAVVVISILANELMARFKFKIGKKENSLALIADAEHSRADSISSMAVLAGLFLTYWFNWADGAAAIIVGLYIFYEIVGLGKEIVDNLLDISNPEIEEKIKAICKEEEIELLEVKTRRLGAQNSVELKIGLNKEWKMQRVDEVTKNLENLLMKKIENLKFIAIQVMSHNFKQGSIKSKTGQIKYFKEMAEKVKLKKYGFRTIISYQNGKLYYDFGAPAYLVIDQNKAGKILQKKVIKNPYFVIGRGHGVRFTQAIDADQVITTEIGKNGRERLNQLGVKVRIVKEGTSIKEIVKSL